VIAVGRELVGTCGTFVERFLAVALEHQVGGTPDRRASVSAPFTKAVPRMSIRPAESLSIRFFQELHAWSSKGRELPVHLSADAAIRTSGQAYRQFRIKCDDLGHPGSKLASFGTRLQIANLFALQWPLIWLETGHAQFTARVVVLEDVPLWRCLHS
jgi:hypothetical protein